MRSQGNLSLHFVACPVDTVSTLYGPARVLRDDNDLEWLAQQVQSVPEDSYIALDLEAWSPGSLRGETGGYFERVQVLLTAVSYEPYWRAVIVHSDSDIPIARWLGVVTARTISVYNASYDIRIVTSILNRFPPRYIDAMILAGLISSGRIPEAASGTVVPGERIPGLSLSDMVGLGLRLPLEKQLRGAFSGTEGVLVDEQLIRYAVEDASATWWLTAWLLEQVHREGITHIAELEHQLAPYLLYTSMVGIRIDESVVREYAEQLRNSISRLHTDILVLLRNDIWTSVGPEQPGIPAEPVDIAALLPKLPQRQLNARDTIGTAARYVLNHTIPAPTVRMGQLAQLALESPHTRLSVFKQVNRPERGTEIRTAMQAIRLDSPSWLTDYIRDLTGGLVIGTKAQQMQTYSNAIAQRELGFLSDHPRWQLAAQLADLILQYRGMTKLLTSFVEPWLNEHIVRKDGIARIYTTFSQTRARSGRIISQNPNMQNIARPRTLESEAGLDQEIDLRSAVIADAGCLLVTADYSQYELRVAAERSGEPSMIEMFLRSWELLSQLEHRLKQHGLRIWHKQQIKQVAERDSTVSELMAQIKDCDLHRWVASLIFGKPQSEITPQERTMAKTVSFGVLYGMTAPSLSQRLHAMGLRCSIHEAEQILDSYFRSFPNLVQYIRDMEAYMLQHGYTSTILGRKRWYLPINPSAEPPDRDPFRIVAGNYRNRKLAANREMFNHTIQGVNADAIKLAIIYLYDALLADPMWQLDREHLVLTIHDELVVQALAEHADAMAELVLDSMIRASRAAGLVTVPTVVEINVESRWSK